MAEDDASVDPAPPQPGLSCPRCRAARVAELPANGITPHPGYRCLDCGARMRGMTATYLGAIAVGLALTAVSAGLVTVFGDERDARLGAVLSPFLIPLYIIAVAYAGRELMRPRPRRIQS